MNGYYDNKSYSISIYKYLYVTQQTGNILHLTYVLETLLFKSKLI